MKDSEGSGLPHRDAALPDRPQFHGPTAPRPSGSGWRSKFAPATWSPTRRPTPPRSGRWWRTSAAAACCRPSRSTRHGGCIGPKAPARWKPSARGSASWTATTRWPHTGSFTVPTAPSERCMRRGACRAHRAWTMRLWNVPFKNPEVLESRPSPPLKWCTSAPIMKLLNTHMKEPDVAQARLRR